MGVNLLTTEALSLGEFLQKYDGHPTIQSCFKSGEVTEILSTLIRFLLDRINDGVDQNSADIVQALRCIKLMTRTRTELELLLDETNIGCIIDLISRQLSAAVDVRNTIANEAVRVLINLCIIHQNDVLAVLHRQRVHLQLLDLLADIDAAPSNDDLTFAISRLLFYMCLDDRIHGNFGGDFNVPKMLADKVQVYIETLDPGGITFSSSTAWNSTCTVLSELLRVLFALGSKMDRKAAYQQIWEPLISPLLRLLLGQNTELLSLSHDELQTIPKSAYYSVMLDIVHLFYCFDESNLRRLLEEDVIHRILSILEIQARYNCASVESALVPILTVIKNLCDLSPTVTQDTKEFVFGAEFANNKSIKYEFEKGDTTLSVADVQPNSPPPSLAKILRQLITTFNLNVKGVVSQFLFTLCSRDPSEYIRVVGFGNAIGLLAQMNLPGFQMPPS